MRDFEFSGPVRVIFGENALTDRLPGELSRYGANVLLAYGGGSIKKNGIYDRIMDMLRGAGKTVTEFSGIMSNPTYAKVQEGAELIRSRSIDFILAVGGGSVIDCCKLVSAQSCLDEDIWEYELTKKKLPSEFIPMGAVITAFGTGAEMNNGAVITNEDARIKFALRGAFYDFSLLDPLCTLTMPMRQVISGAFDSLSHCMETYMGSPRGTCLSDELNESVQRNIIRNLRAVTADPQDIFARGELMWTAALTENRLLKIGKVVDFQCHNLEHQLGAYTSCSHGDALAVIHPALYGRYLPEAEEQFARLAANVWGISPAGRSRAQLAEGFLQALEEFIRENGLPATFAEMGIPADTDYRAVAESTIISPGCPKTFTAEELYDVLICCDGRR